VFNRDFVARQANKIESIYRDQYCSGEVEWTTVFGVWSTFKEVEMQKHVLVLTTTVAFLACGAIAAGAQAPAPIPSQQNPTTQPIPSGPMMQQRLKDHAQSGEEEDDPDERMMGMMGRGYGHHGCHGGHGMVGMRIIFSLMDADGDGTVSLPEWQAAQERIFRAMDADHDGTVTFEEMQDFMRGVSRPVSHQ
jgi:EF hand